MYRERPLFIPLVAYASGLYISDLCGFLLSWTSVAATLLCLTFACCIRNSLPLQTLSFFFFIACGLHALTPWKTPSTLSSADQWNSSRAPVAVEGIIRSRPVIDSNGSRFVLRVERIIKHTTPIPVDGDMQVFVTAGDITLNRGDRVRFLTRITVPHKLGLPGEFDYARYLQYNGIAAVGRVATPDEIVLLRGADKDSLLRKIDLTARQLGNYIRASVPDPSLSSVLTALLVGDQKRIPQQLSDAYTRAGVNHILSISGFHIGIIAYFIVHTFLLVLTRMEFTTLYCNLRRTVLLLSLPAMLFYLFLTGAAPATSRSVIMLTAFVLALYAEREIDPVNTLLLSALLLLFQNPPSLFDVSFQLSFLALWGIVIAVPPIMERFGNHQTSWVRTLIQFVATSCAASCVTIIPVLFAFNQASLNGILANFLIVPLLGYGAVLAGFCALPMVYIFTPLADLLLLMAGQLVKFSNTLIIFFGELPLIRFHGITKLDMFLFLACLSLFTFLRPSRLKYTLCALLPATAVAMHLTAPARADGRLHVTMLSVGQAESLLVRLPDGSTMLVDGGGYLYESQQDFGERILAPSLHKLGVRRIDRMLLTHGHPDHCGGLAYLVKTMPVGEFWQPADTSQGDHCTELHAALAANRVPGRKLSEGDVIQLGDVILTVFSPPAVGFHSTTDSGVAVTNEDSLVFRLAYGQIGILFAGDAGSSTERRIMADGAGLASTLLKVGHHGSRFSTSDDFLDQVAPAVALISAGQNNNFSLPSPETLQRLRRHGVTTYRTDLDGTIEFVSDGRNWNVTTPFRADLNLPLTVSVPSAFQAPCNLKGFVIKLFDGVLEMR